MKKTILALVLTATAATVTAAQLVEAIVIRVGDRVVTRTQYARRLHEGFAEIEQTSTTPAEAASKKDDLRKNLSTDLIAELLIKDRADRLGLSVSAEELKEAMTRLKEQYGIKTDAAFDESLQKSGMTRADMEGRLHDTLLTNKVFARELRQRDELTDKELRERYNREKERYRLPERARLREIIVIKPDDPTKVEAARQRANALAEQARTGDFVKLATTSSDAGTKDKGGDLGEVARGELLPDLDKAVFNATAGTVLGPIETKSGWHILKVETRLPSEVPAFESVKDRLRKDASEDAWQRDYKAYIDRLRKEAFIQINEQNVPNT
ncbi:MAG TPA: peptidylprolyl isomerase [Thermoanaerobaculia bacterium]